MGDQEYIAEFRNHAATRVKISFESLNIIPEFFVEPGQSLTFPQEYARFEKASGGVKPEFFMKIQVEAADGFRLLRVWQSSFALEDRVRVWGEGPFEPPGAPIGLFASMGPA